MTDLTQLQQELENERKQNQELQEQTKKLKSEVEHLVSK